MTKLFLCLSFLFAGEISAQIKNTTDMPEGKGGIQFTEGKWQDIRKKAKSSGRYIFVDAYTSWCAPCKLLKSKTFIDQNAAGYFNKHFINYTIDMEKGEGLELAEQWEVMAYPTLLIFSPDGKMLKRQIGFVDGMGLIDFGKSALAAKN